MNKVAIYLLFLSTAFLSAEGVAPAANGKKSESAKPALTTPLPPVPAPGPSGVESKPLAKDLLSQPKPAAPSFTHLQLSSDGSVPSSAGVSSNLEVVLKKYEDRLNKKEEVLRKYDEKLGALESSLSSSHKEITRLGDSISVSFVLMLFVIILQLNMIWPRFFLNSKRSVQGDGMDSSVQDEALDALKQAIASLKNALTQTKTELSQQIKPLSEVAPKLTKAIADFSDQKGKLDALQLRFDKCEADLEASSRDCEAARAEVAPLQERINRLSAEAETLKSDLSDARNNLDTARSERETSRNSEMELRKDKDELSGKKSQLESELKSERDSLASAKEALLAARQAAETNGVQLEASFARLAPKFLADPEIAQFMRKLHGESLAGVGSATAAWSTLTAFASAEADPAAKDFQLHVLKRLGTVLSHYWKEQPGSTPRDRLERLSHWARCLNEQAQGRFNLFVPAIGAPVDRTKMATLTSATVVQEVLCWQVRNPAGANYSLAEVA
jgi:predicted  nucleic acid-binding Zn-ribbon protein